MPYKNKEDQQRYARQHYLDNKELYKQRAKGSDKRYIVWYKELKSSLSCSKCGESRPACIEFHHPDGNKNEFNISQMVNRKWGKKRVLEEIAKCETLCSNCHKDFHWSHLFNNGLVSQLA